MSKPTEPTLRPMARKLELWNRLPPEDCDALLALPHTVRPFEAGHYVVWDGDRPQHCGVLLGGYAARHKNVGDGGRQIFSVHMRGDVLDLQNSLLGRADHNVQMITDGEVALIPVEAIRDIAATRPAVGMAMWYETLVEASIFREWITNVGRRDARTRLCHLLCEIALRVEAVGLGDRRDFTLPMTQEQLADATSLTSIHVNRTLQGLSADGLIVRSRRSVTVPDWARLAEAGDFSPDYLHLERAN